MSGNKKYVLFLTLVFTICSARAQDSSIYRLRLSVPVFDAPQNTALAYSYPSMNQALELGNDFYELGYWGIDGLGDKLFKRSQRPYKGLRKISNKIFKYALGFGFSYYGSELPVPLGVWAHEEFHRSVLGTGNIRSKNGNWIGNRWDGTVYGVSDSSLSHLKTADPHQLLYSYVAGVQSEILFNERTTLSDFYKKRSFHKNSFLLYNAYYVYNYFKFSTSSATDSVKVLAPPHENKNPAERDYAGADLTAWAYDMFNADSAYTNRDPFPDGEGVNRRIGSSDLSEEARKFLSREKKLSLINFINPAIFFINRIKINTNFSFLFFMQYAPTHYGHDVAYFFPFQYKKYDILLAMHTYSNKEHRSYGLQMGLYNYKLSRLFETDLVLHVWDQPDSYYGSKQFFGGAIDLRIKAKLNAHVDAFAGINGKTKGWETGNPYLKDNVSFRFGINYNLRRH